MVSAIQYWQSLLLICGPKIISVIAEDAANVVTVSSATQQDC